MVKKSLDRIVKPVFILRSPESIAAEMRLIILSRKENPERDPMMRDICMHSFIQDIDGNCISRAIGRKETEAARYLVIYGIQKRLLEKDAKIFAHYEKEFKDLRELIKDGTLCKGETLTSEMLYVAELAKIKRSPTLRDQDKTYATNCLDKFHEYWII